MITNSPTVTRAPRRHGAGHIVAIVAGCLALFPGLGLLAGGTAVAIAQAVATDDDGYYSYTLDRVESDGVAVSTSELWFDDGDGEPWVLDWIDLDVRLRVDGAAGSDDVFVGIARTADVEDYLAAARHSVVTELDDRTPVYRQVSGERPIAPPAEQDFWVATTNGTGEQELTWDARGGRWAVVVMNADGAPGVAADVELAARSDAVTPIAVGLLVAGGFVTLLAVGLIVFGARGRKDPAPPLSVGPGSWPPPTSPLPPTGPETPATSDLPASDREDDRHPHPVG